MEVPCGNDPPTDATFALMGILLTVISTLGIILNITAYLRWTKRYLSEKIIRSNVNALCIFDIVDAFATIFGVATPVFHSYFVKSSLNVVVSSSMNHLADSIIHPFIFLIQSYISIQLVALSFISMFDNLSPFQSLPNTCMITRGLFLIVFGLSVLLNFPKFMELQTTPCFMRNPEVQSINIHPTFVRFYVGNSSGWYSLVHVTVHLIIPTILIISFLIVGRTNWYRQLRTNSSNKYRFRSMKPMVVVNLMTRFFVLVSLVMCVIQRHHGVDETAADDAEVGLNQYNAMFLITDKRSYSYVNQVATLLIAVNGLGNGIIHMVFSRRMKVLEMRNPNSDTAFELNRLDNFKEERVNIPSGAYHLQRPNTLISLSPQMV